ncbi:MAG: glycosyltransferase family 4 protein [Bacteroides sp.]|nr:glycosyltransferase family 4 protein [Bacteroides sp.]MCM1378747.1 glycosyltransferase family 4 protein [Bacteroides sp.]MCM1445364.1 glycosyltransferase family 4 protein [Prevotella sp.]
MRILLVTSHFYPENFKANDMAFELQRRGHQVTVLAPIPDYPRGHYFEGYGVFRRRVETINGVRVVRSLIIPRHDGSAKWLALNYLSHTASSTICGLWLGLRHRYDAVLVHETSPVMVGIPAVLVKKMQRIPMHFWVLDLWPESLEAAGGIHNRHVLGVFRSLTRWIYRNSDRILISSKGFRKSINALGDFDSRIEFFPNWVDDALSAPADVATPRLPEGFNVMFAGNIGDAQDMPHILDAAELLRDTNINFILVGDGRRKEWAEQEKERRKLGNVYLLGRFPLEAMPAIFAKADVLFLALKNDPIFALTVPAKLQAYMSAGKPIVAMINGEGAATIADADCGWSVPAESPAPLAALLRRLSQNESSMELISKGAKGAKYADEHYNFSRCIDNLLK